MHADHASKYNAGFRYTSFFGGKYKVIKDRDLMALSVGISF